MKTEIKTQVKKISKEELSILQDEVGQMQINDSMTKIIGALIIVVLAVALAPTMFSSVSDLVNSTGVPSWVPTVLYVIIGAGIVFLIWRVFMGNR